MQYPIDRFTMETKRQLDVLNRHLSDNEYMAGSEYSIADIAIWPWYGSLVLGDLYDAAEFLDVASYTHVCLPAFLSAFMAYSQRYSEASLSFSPFIKA